MSKKNEYFDDISEVDAWEDSKQLEKLRDIFASMAMQVMLTKDGLAIHTVANLSYRMADELLKARGEVKP